MIWSGRSGETASNDCNLYDNKCQGTAMGKSFEISEKVKAVQRSAVRFCMAEINCYTFRAASENFPTLNSMEVTGHGQRRGHVRNDNPA
jgi:hypothetical protein